jgi:hypothetical protein
MGEQGPAQRRREPRRCHMRARALAVLYGILLVGFLAQEVLAQNLLMRRQCYTDFQGQVWRGVMQIEFALLRHKSHLWAVPGFPR